MFINLRVEQAQFTPLIGIAVLKLILAEMTPADEHIVGGPILDESLEKLFWVGSAVVFFAPFLPYLRSFISEKIRQK